ncbi:MAG: hypothetical protein MJ252_21325 [archaeon]|nr:hypothetical protein [archaeon]
MNQEENEQKSEKEINLEKKENSLKIENYKNQTIQVDKEEIINKIIYDTNEENIELDAESKIIPINENFTFEQIEPSKTKRRHKSCEVIRNSSNKKNNSRNKKIEEEKEFKEDTNDNMMISNLRSINIQKSNNLNEENEVDIERLKELQEENNQLKRENSILSTKNLEFKAKLNKLKASVNFDISQQKSKGTLQKENEILKSKLRKMEEELKSKDDLIGRIFKKRKNLLKTEKTNSFLIKGLYSCGSNFNNLNISGISSTTNRKVSHKKSTNDFRIQTVINVIIGNKNKSSKESLSVNKNNSDPKINKAKSEGTKKNKNLNFSSSGVYNLDDFEENLFEKSPMSSTFNLPKENNDYEESNLNYPSNPIIYIEKQKKIMSSSMKYINKPEILKDEEKRRGNGSIGKKNIPLPIATKSKIETTIYTKRTPKSNFNTIQSSVKSEANTVLWPETEREEKNNSKDKSKSKEKEKSKEKDSSKNKKKSNDFQKDPILKLNNEELGNKKVSSKLKNEKQSLIMDVMNDDLFSGLFPMEIKSKPKNKIAESSDSVEEFFRETNLKNEMMDNSFIQSKEGGTIYRKKRMKKYKSVENIHDSNKKTQFKSNFFN